MPTTEHPTIFVKEQWPADVVEVGQIEGRGYVIIRAEVRTNLIERILPIEIFTTPPVEGQRLVIKLALVALTESEGPWGSDPETPNELPGLSSLVSPL